MHWRRSLLVALACVFWSAQAWAAIDCVDANFAQTTATGQTSIALAIPTNTQTGDLIVVGTLNRSNETTVISSIVGSVNGAYSLVNGPIDHSTSSLRSWMHYFENSGAGTETVTVTFDGSINSELVVGRCTGARTSGALSANASTNTSTTQSVTSASVNVPSAGAVIGLFATNNARTITAVGSGESDVSVATLRVHVTYQPSVTGNHTLEVTWSADLVSTNSHIGAFLEPAGGGGSTACRNLLLLGVGGSCSE